MQPTPASLVAGKPLTLKFEIKILKLKLGKEAAKCHRSPEARKISCIIKINLCEVYPDLETNPHWWEIIPSDSDNMAGYAYICSKCFL